MRKDAIISACDKYRYLLSRTWDDAEHKLLYVMLNPSTADASVDDATIRSCVRLAKSLGYGGIEVVNLMAWRATKPENVPLAADVARGPDNLSVVESALARCSYVVAAWGAHPLADSHAQAVLDLVGRAGKPVYCFGTTKEGKPRHPLYVRTGTQLEAFIRV